MKTAREFCHDFQRLVIGEDCGRFGDTCDEECDEFTAAIEARDAEHALDITAEIKRYNAMEAERDAARAARRAADAECAATMRDLAALRTERDRLREACQRIAEYETDWTKGPDANVAALQAIAERALGASPATPTPGPPPRHPRQVAAEAALEVACPKCGAEVGIWCPVQGWRTAICAERFALVGVQEDGAARPPDAVPGTPEWYRGREKWRLHEPIATAPPQPVCLRCGGTGTTYGDGHGNVYGYPWPCPSCQPKPKVTP